ncbi:hypothetical protein D3C86_2069960 [compost metagenome]
MPLKVTRELLVLVRRSIAVLLAERICTSTFWAGFLPPAATALLVRLPVAWATPTFSK